MRAWVSSMVLVVGLCLGRPAIAHPFGAKYAAHRVDLHVERNTVTVGFIAEVPTGILTASRGADPFGEMERELISGLVLQINGETTPLHTLGPTIIETNDDAYQFGLALQATHDAPVETVVFSDGNLPDVPGVFSASATVQGGLHVLDSSLLHIKDGRVARDDSGRWRMGTGHRQTTLHVDAPSTLWRLAAPAPPTAPVPLSQAYILPWLALLQRPVITPAVAVVAAAMALGGGLCTDRAAAGHLALAAWIAVPLTLGLQTPVTEYIALVLGVATLAAAAKNHPHAGTLLISGIAIATQAPLLAAFTLLVYTIASHSRFTWAQGTAVLASAVVATTLARLFSG